MPGPACYDHDYDDPVRVARGPSDADPEATTRDDLDECWCCNGLHDTFGTLCPDCREAGCNRFTDECESDHDPVLADGGHQGTHIDADEGLWIPPERRAFESQIVIRTPRSTIQHFESGGGSLNPYFGLVDESHFGDPDDIRDPKNPGLAPRNITLKPQGEDAVEFYVSMPEEQLATDGGHGGTTDEGRLERFVDHPTPDRFFQQIEPAEIEMQPLDHDDVTFKSQLVPGGSFAVELTASYTYAGRDCSQHLTLDRVAAESLYERLGEVLEADPRE